MRYVYATGETSVLVYDEDERFMGAVVVSPLSPQWRTLVEDGVTIEPAPPEPPPTPPVPFDRLAAMTAPKVVVGSRSTQAPSILQHVLVALNDAGIIINQTRELKGGEMAVITEVGIANIQASVLMATPESTPQLLVSYQTVDGDGAPVRTIENPDWYATADPQSQAAIQGLLLAFVARAFAEAEIEAGP